MALQRKDVLLWGLFFLAVLALSLVAASWFSQGWITVLDRAGIVLGLFLSCLAGAGILLGIVRAPELRSFAARWLRARQFAHAGQVVKHFGERVDAMVIPIGVKGTEAEWVIRHLKPGRVSLVFTAEGRDAAAEVARKLEAEADFDPSATEIEHRRAMVLGDLLDPQETRRMVRHHLERFLERGIDRRRIFVDTTGGTSPMSMGALQAAEQMDVSSIYVMGLMTDGERRGRILDPEDPSQAEPRFMSDHTRAAEVGSDGD